MTSRLCLMKTPAPTPSVPEYQWASQTPLAARLGPFPRSENGPKLPLGESTANGRNEPDAAEMECLGGCVVVDVNRCMRFDDLPDDLPGREKLSGFGDWLSPGNGSIIAPGGRVLAGPAQKTLGLIEVEVDLSAVAERRRLFDVVGHYSRPDVLTLNVDATLKEPVRFS